MTGSNHRLFAKFREFRQFFAENLYLPCPRSALRSPRLNVKCKPPTPVLYFQMNEKHEMTESVSEFMKSRYLAFAIALVLGMAMTGWGAYKVWRAAASADWPETTGSVTKSRVQETIRPRYSRWLLGRYKYSPQITYRYTIGGRSYVNDEYSFWDAGSGDAGEARGIVRRYPPGRQVVVHYNPDDPGISVLHTGMDWSSAATLGIGLLLLLAAVLLHLTDSRGRGQKKPPSAPAARDG